MSVTQVARNFSEVLDMVEKDQEEVILVRNRRPVARLVPEPSAQDALAVLGDLHRMLDDETANALAESVMKTRKSKKGKLNELRNPWGS